MKKTFMGVRLRRLREERGIKQLKKSAKEALVASYLAIQAADGVPSA